MGLVETFAMEPKAPRPGPNMLPRTKRRIDVKIVSFGLAIAVVVAIAAAPGLAAAPSRGAASMPAGQSGANPGVKVVSRTTKAVNFRRTGGAAKIDFQGTELMQVATGE